MAIQQLDKEAKQQMMCWFNARLSMDDILAISPAAWREIFKIWLLVKERIAYVDQC